MNMKSKTKMIASLALTAVLLAGAYAALAAPQTTCPVLGNTVNPNIFTDYNGKRIYFCCPPCVGQFKKDPEAYLKKLAEMDQEPEAVPGS